MAEPGMRPHEYVILEIARERERQIGVEGWTPERDDQLHQQGGLAVAAGCYAKHASGRRDLSWVRHEDGGLSRIPRGWPWHPSWWKPTTPSRDLVKAAALIVAEIGRLDRAAASKSARDKDVVSNQEPQ